MRYIETLKNYDEDRIYTVKWVINNEDYQEDFDSKQDMFNYIKEIYKLASELDIFILEEYEDDRIEEECVFTK